MHLWGTIFITESTLGAHKEGLEVTINPGALLGALLISGVMWYAIFHGFVALTEVIK